MGYERIRGLREVGQNRASKTFNASKTFPIAISALYAVFSQKRKRVQWLGDVEMTVRTS